MSVKLLTEHHLEFLSLKEGSTGVSESTLLKMPHCWKSHVAAQIYLYGLWNTYYSLILALLFLSRPSAQQTSQGIQHFLSDSHLAAVEISPSMWIS